MNKILFNVSFLLSIFFLQACEHIQTPHRKGNLDQSIISSPLSTSSSASSSSSSTSTSSTSSSTTPSSSTTNTTTGAPVTPQLYVTTTQNTNSSDYNITVEWDIWWGNNATSWKLFETVGSNSESLIQSGTIHDGTPQPQQVLIQVLNRTVGTYNYRILLTNALGLTSQATIQATPGSYSNSGNTAAAVPTSSILIQDVDTTSQLSSQISLSMGQLQTFQIKNADSNYQITLTNPSLLSQASVSSTGLISLKGISSGRTGMKIKNTQSGATRMIGISIKNQDGSNPGLPNYLAMGSVSQDDPGVVNFWQDIGTGLTNKRMDIRYIYLNDGPGQNGWHTWGGGNRVTTFVNNSLSFGMIPFFVYYNINNGQDSLGSIMANIQSRSFMEAYYQDLKLAVTQAKAAAGDSRVGFLMEPDFLGYILQSNPSSDPTTIAAVVSAAYSSGVLSSTQDPTFPNTLTGLVQSLNYVIHKYNSNAYVGWQLNLWSNPANAGGQGIIHATDTLGLQAGRAAIRSNAVGLMQFAKKAGITYLADYVSIDKYGLDGGQQAGAPTNPSSSIWLWNADHWNNYLYFASTLHQESSLPMILWQLPVGHINQSNAVSPYTQSTFPALANTTSTYEDSAPDYFLGDSFSSSTNVRSNSFFASNLSQDSKISNTSSTITWGSHAQEAVSAGVVAVLFGAGVGISTQGTPTPNNPDITKPTDDYWWISKIQNYYSNPALGTIRL